MGNKASVKDAEWEPLSTRLLVTVRKRLEHYRAQFRGQKKKSVQECVGEALDEYLKKRGA